MRSVIQMMLWPPVLLLNIPTGPASIYIEQGWAGFQDWMGEVETVNGHKTVTFAGCYSIPYRVVSYESFIKQH